MNRATGQGDAALVGANWMEECAGQAAMTERAASWLLFDHSAQKSAPRRAVVGRGAKEAPVPELKPDKL